MNKRWCLSALIFILTLYVVVNQQQNPIPNQEIVLQFNTTTVNVNETNKAIASVKKQLEVVGADNIQVKEQEDGLLRIAYYSESDVASIKKMLSDEKGLTFGYVSSKKESKNSDCPSEENPTSYNLDIYELKSLDAESGFGGKNATEVTYETNRFFIPSINIAQNTLEVQYFDSFSKTSSKYGYTTAIVIDTISHIIPEVRAGPTS